MLVPPSENRDFTISLVSLDSPQKYGELESSFCDDFDYKIVAHADADQNVNIRIYRNEYNVEAIPLSFYNREISRNIPIDEKTLCVDIGMQLVRLDNLYLDSEIQM